MRLVSAATIPTTEGGIRITVSVGVSGMSHESAEMAEVIRSVDAVLYWAKQSGRNRVVVQTSS